MVQVEALNQWTTHTSRGVPFPAATAPCLPHSNKERLVAVEEILQTYIKPRPDIGAMLELLLNYTGCVSAAITILTAEGTCVKQSAGLLPEGQCFRGTGICHWLLDQDSPEVLMIEDLRQDARTSTKDVVVNQPFMRSYAAAPLITKSYHCIGSLCLWTQQCRSFNNVEIAVLANFAEITMRLIESTQHRVCPSTLLTHSPRSDLISSATQTAYGVVNTKGDLWKISWASQHFLQGLRHTQGTLTTHGTLPEDAGQARIIFDDDRLVTLHSASTETETKGQRHSGWLVPIDADMLDQNVIEIAKPFGMCDSDHCNFGLYFLILTDSKPIRQPKVPFQNIQVGRLLGKGHYGRVYSAVWKEQKVALKVVDEFEDTVDIEGVPAEAALLKGVKHSSIVELLAYRLTCQGNKKRLWLLSEFCNAGTLLDAVTRGDFRMCKNPEAEICLPALLETAQQIAEGILHMHKAGILHCDLSGGNVLLHRTPCGQQFAKLTDFGLSRLAAASYHTAPTGTRAYLAPEVMDDKPQTKASDIYSFGVLLYEMFCGQRAWAGLSDVQITFAVMWGKEQLTMPSSAPADFSGFVSNCLDHNPDSRPCGLTVLRMIKELRIKHQTSSTDL